LVFLIFFFCDVNVLPSYENRRAIQLSFLRREDTNDIDDNNDIADNEEDEDEVESCFANPRLSAFQSPLAALRNSSNSSIGPERGY